MEEKAALCKSSVCVYEDPRGWWGLVEAPCGAASPPPWAAGLPGSFSSCWICWSSPRGCECQLGKALKNSWGSRFFHGAWADIWLVSFLPEALPDLPLLVRGTQARAKQAQPGFWSPGANVSLQRDCSQPVLNPKVDVKLFELYVGSCGIGLSCSLIFGVPWLENKGGGLDLGSMLKLRDECGKDSAPESGV